MNHNLVVKRDAKFIKRERLKTLWHVVGEPYIRFWLSSPPSTRLCLLSQKVFYIWKMGIYMFNSHTVTLRALRHLTLDLCCCSCPVFSQAIMTLNLVPLDPSHHRASMHQPMRWQQLFSTVSGIYKVILSS